jgi:hypothetical protein
MPTSASASFETLGRFRGCVHAAHRDPATRAALAGIAERMAAPDAIVLQAGRNLTVRLSLPTEGTRVDVAVKRFGRQMGWKDWLAARNGTKAWRAYQAAAHLHARGVGTPPPVAVLEQWEGQRLVASYLVTRFVPGLRSFRRELVDLYERHGPCEGLMALLERIAVAVAAMHDAGFLHRDLGNQNVLLTPPDAATGARGVLVIDLNRGRCRPGPLSNRERARDLSRIHLPSDFLRVFTEMYWRGVVPPDDFRRWEKRYRKRYAWHAASRRLRHPFRRAGGPSPDGEYPPDRDLWIWDERSVQAIPAFRSRDRHRLRPPGRVFWTLVAVLRGAWPAWRAYRGLQSSVFQRPVEGVGERAAVALTARVETFDRELALLRELGARRVLVRLYHHEDEARRRFTLVAVKRLHADGCGVALALVQDRRAVLDPAAWAAFGREALREVGGRLRWVEVGHAVNRVKWGVWGYAELAALHAPVAAWSREFPGVRFTGPAVIDFEADYLMAALRWLPRDVRYAALSHHLYVDRRGAPEAKQGAFDAIRKLALVRAAGQASGRFGDGLIVSEFNWPLRGTGVWSPVGSPYESPGERRNDPSVDETQAALFTLRYLLLGVCSGLADEMVFWRLAAHGFGLVDDSDAGSWRRRPAFEALRTWHAGLNGATYTACASQPGYTRLQFETVEGRALSVAWCWPVCAAADVPDALLHGRGRRWDAFGHAVADDAAERAALAAGMPVYRTEA